MTFYAILLYLIRQNFCGNEHRAARAYLYIIGFIFLMSIIMVTIINIKMLIL